MVYHHLPLEWWWYCAGNNYRPCPGRTQVKWCFPPEREVSFWRGGGREWIWNGEFADQKVRKLAPAATTKVLTACFVSHHLSFLCQILHFLLIVNDLSISPSHFFVRSLPLAGWQIITSCRGQPNPSPRPFGGKKTKEAPRSQHDIPLGAWVVTLMWHCHDLEHLVDVTPTMWWDDDVMKLQRGDEETTMRMTWWPNGGTARWWENKTMQVTGQREVEKFQGEYSVELLMFYVYIYHS